MKLLQYSHLLSLSIFNILPDNNTERRLFLLTLLPSLREYTSDCHSYLTINYYLHVETVPANMGARQVRDHYNIILSFSRIREP